MNKITFESLRLYDLVNLPMNEKQYSREQYRNLSIEEVVLRVNQALSIFKEELKKQIKVGHKGNIRKYNEGISFTEKVLKLASESQDVLELDSKL